MSVELVRKYAPATDELFKAESKISLLTNTDYDWSGANSVLIYKISTAEMNDYKRNSTGVDDDTISRYGVLADLNATTEEHLLKKDRSFIFNIDKLDTDETAGQLEAGKCLARQLREVVIPEVDSYVYQTMVDNAGTKITGTIEGGQDLYSKITAANEALDDAEVPETARVLVVNPAVYRTLKLTTEFYDGTSISEEMRKRGVIAMLDGLQVIKVPASRLPENFGFMVAHPSATVAPTKLADYHVHKDTPLSSGSIVTGRICYDCFVLDNKKTGIYCFMLG